MSIHEQHIVFNTLLQQAEEMYRRRLAKDPHNEALLSSLAQIYRKQGNLTEAQTIYKQLTLLNPEDTEAAYMHAILAGTDVPVRPAGIRPAPFVLIKDFLPRSFHETLLPFMSSVQDKLVPALVVSGVYNPESRQSLDLPGEWEVKKRFSQFVLEILPTCLARLHVSSFEIDECEVKVRAYLDGHFFQIHMDCPREPKSISNRKVSYIYFFHKMPRAYTGGDVVLFDSDPDIDHARYTTAGFTRVVPEDNSLVLFPSAYWHSVVPVSCPSKQYADSRFVINGHVKAPAK
jgi:tetratricopeptide (TPR) repeat protein